MTALDIGRTSDCDMPPKVRERVECGVYDLDPATLGMFDLVHVGDLLLHLENPIAALRAIRSVTAGQAMFSGCVDPSSDNANNTVWRAAMLATP